MKKYLRRIALLLPLVVLMSCVENNQYIPIHLTCEYEIDPIGIDQASPDVSWQIQVEERNWQQSAYQIIVSSSPEKLSKDEGDVWNTGKVASIQNIHIRYEGKELQSLQTYYWKVKTWGKDDSPSSWSKPAKWSMALLSKADWENAQWIGAREKLPLLGYQSLPADDVHTKLWIELELPEPTVIDSIVLHSANLNDWLLTERGLAYGFPLRFRIDVSGDTKSNLKRTIVSEEDTDYPNPGSMFLNFRANRFAEQPDVNSLKRTYLAGEKPVQTIRLSASKLWKTHGFPACLSMGEIEVFSGGKNIAKEGKLSATNSLENEKWSLSALVDGESLCRKEKNPTESAALYLRKTFNAGKKIKKATASISGLGYNELYINGNKVGNRLMQPTFTDYNDRVSFNTYDLTAAIKKDSNTIGVILGNGYYNMSLYDTWGFHQAPWKAPKKMILHMNLEYADGSQETFISDESWKWSFGPIIYNSIRGGETVDTRKSMPGWNTNNFESDSWQPVLTVPAPKGKLVAQYTTPIAVDESIQAIEISEPKPNVYVIDFGLNLSGWIQFKARGKAGQKLTFEFNEALDSTGLVDTKHGRKFTYGRFQTGEMILDGGEINTYEPKFTYHAFRYVQVSGLTEKPNLEDILAKRVHADIQEAGSFSCSNELMNKAQEVLLRTAENYIHHHPADPIREKLGWTQDAQTMADMSMYNFQMPKLYKKWIQDFYDAQEESGHVIPIAPTSGWGGWQPDGKPGVCSDPWWGGAAVYLPWDCYRFYGDVRFLKDGYENMKRYVDFLGTTADDYILDWQLGDWLEVGTAGIAVRTPLEQTSTSAYYYQASLLEKIAGILNEEKDETKYRLLKENIGESFNRHFLDEKTGIYADDSQTSQILPLTLGMVPEAQKDLALKALIENINKRDKHLSVGFVGLVPLMHGLDDLGEAELSYKIAAQEDFPGWLLMVKETGSIWESWDAFESSNDQDFISLGSSLGRKRSDKEHLPGFCFISLGGPLGSWMYRTLGGIRPDEHLPGFKHIIIKPAIVNELEWVKSKHQSPYGEIVSNWETKDGKLTMDITIPPNTTSSIYIPAKDSDSITESGIEIENSTSFKWKRFNDEKVLVKVGSGKYHFEVVKI